MRPGVRRFQPHEADLKPIRVLLVDDSAVVRQVLTEQLARDPAISVMAAVADPLFAMARMQKEWPDVIVLDIEMPRMDGLSFLRKVMDERPTPVIICSTLAEQGAATTLEALAAGAVAIVTKPRLGLKQFLTDASSDLTSTIKAAAQANMRQLRPAAQRSPGIAQALASPATRVESSAAGAGPLRQTTERIVAIGASTDGTQAIESILVALPRGSPGVAIVQHMPEKFTQAFAERLNRLCEVEVREARHGERLLPGHILIAPGGRHMTLRRNGAYYCVEVVDGPLVNRHRPSVDVLFRSVAKCAGTNALGLILTGMGDDGARGLKEMRDAGSPTLAQDEATCVVYGMPKEALRIGAAQRALPLMDLPRAIVDWGAGRLNLRSG